MFVPHYQLTVAVVPLGWKTWREEPTAFCLNLKEPWKMLCLSVMTLLVLYLQQGTEEDAGARWGRDPYSAGYCLGEPGYREYLPRGSVAYSMWETALAQDSLLCSRFLLSYAIRKMFSLIFFFFFQVAILMGFSSVLLGFQCTEGRAKPCSDNSESITL